MMKVALFTVILLVNFSLVAKEIILANVSNNLTEDTSILSAHVDSENKLISFTAKSYKKGKHVETLNYMSEEIRKGVVLFKESGINIVKVRSRDFNEFIGGEMKVTYLYNGLKKKYRSMVTHLTFDVTWHLEDDDGNHYKKINCLIRRYVGLPIGINKIVLLK